MLDGTVAAEVFELDNVTSAPPVGAAWLSVAVPETVVPARAVVGLSVSRNRAGGAGVTVSVVVFVVPLYTAVRVTDVEEVTPNVVTVNVAELAPLRTATLPATDAALEFELD